TSWIDYKTDVNSLSVFLSYSPIKPRDPILFVTVDLSEYFRGNDSVYVGFSASAEKSTELHQIDSWSFYTVGFEPARPRLRSHNVSDNSVSVSTGNEGVRKCTSKNFGTGIVGHGSFGTVYKAFFISSGTIAAVKRSRHSHEGKTEFLSELSIIAGLRYKNLVQLLGWCVEKGELLLVYDFMPNGSLDKMLYKEPERGKLLNWSHRVNIVVGLASVLVYLHQECEQRVIHRDIKTANVLLDGNFNPRLGDFGLAKLMDHDK
ncbi:putative L-type lectin-domain containing receptor kinase, partial [Trifolium medium]|nr:putative L-type lectin-domain containing receptor kinase [Trifolium medium]